MSKRKPTLEDFLEIAILWGVGITLVGILFGIVCITLVTVML